MWEKAPNRYNEFSQILTKEHAICRLHISHRSTTKARRSENFYDCFKFIVFQIGHVLLTSADTYRRDFYCLALVFQNLPAPPKQYGVFDVFCDFQSFFQLENLGSHLAMCPDDRFLPQGKQILPEICHVRPMSIPYLHHSTNLRHRKQFITVFRNLLNLQIRKSKQNLGVGEKFHFPTCISL